jgi:hypothetical protein
MTASASPVDARPPGPARSPDLALDRLLRSSVALVWLATGVLVVHPFYRSVGAAWLARLGLGPGLMLATCVGEVALGLALLARPTTFALAALQTATVVVFTGILVGLDPALLVHPLGLLTKNVPLLAVVWAAQLAAKEGFSARVERLLRVGMAFIWITEGLFPKILFQQSFELVLVERWGLRPASVVLLVTGLAQLASGVLALAAPPRVRRWVLAAQMVALVVLPALVTLAMPALWVHPFGPLTKNLPILVGTFVLYRRCASTSS